MKNLTTPTASTKPSGLLTKNFLKVRGFHQGTSPGGSGSWHFAYRDKLKSGSISGSTDKGFVRADIFDMEPIENYKFGFKQLNHRSLALSITTKAELLDFINDLNTL